VKTREPKGLDTVLLSMDFNKRLSILGEISQNYANTTGATWNCVRQTNYWATPRVYVSQNINEREKEKLSLPKKGGGDYHQGMERKRKRISRSCSIKWEGDQHICKKGNSRKN